VIVFPLDHVYDFLYEELAAKVCQNIYLKKTTNHIRKRNGRSYARLRIRAELEKILQIMSNLTSCGYWPSQLSSSLKNSREIILYAIKGIDTDSIFAILHNL